MKREIKAPSVGESITEVRIAKWVKQEGQFVKTGEVLLEIESDKATVEVVADISGVLNILKPVGSTVKVHEVVGSIDDKGQPKTSVVAEATLKPTSASHSISGGTGAVVASDEMSYSPAVERLVRETHVDTTKISGTGKEGRVTKGDVLNYLEKQKGGLTAELPPQVGSTLSEQKSPSAPQDIARQRRVTMSLLRQKIAERLVQAQHTAAILTTFNECDMSSIAKIRLQNKDAFKEKHGVSLGFMSFFIRACVEALKEISIVNAKIDGKDIIYQDYYDIGIAVGTDRGLVVPVLRDVDKMDFVAIEKGVAALAEKARQGKLTIQELTGGTFTISNGGVYGSLLSTPILNPPQSGILGMHKIQDKPVVVNGQVAVRPMMYLALSYDHRLVDGKEAVTFLVKVKEGIENPEKLGWRF